ncbi:MAG: DUF503 domain-containing protein [Anaerolinea sp.]|nr:DUF503 domain-containing protein [Anaerolinea sp.]
MPRIAIGLCTLELHLPGVESLKDKRSILKSLLKRLHNTFNVATSEVDYHDTWDASVIAIVTVTTSTHHIDQTLSTIINWIEKNYPDAQIVNQEIEIV